MTVGSSPLDPAVGWDDDLDGAWPHSADAPRRDRGGLPLLDVVAAVDHLARGLRHEFTVWDAVEEALRWWLAERASSRGTPPDGPDPLRARLAEVLDELPEDADITVADVLEQSLRRWATAMAGAYNAGYHWPHPAPRREFPPPLVDP